MNITQRFAIFDMDGTLVNSMIYWDMVVGEFLHTHGFFEEGLLETMKPMTLAQSAEFLQERFGRTFSVSEIVSQMCELMLGHYLHDVQVKPGVQTFLDNLKSRNVQMCVASSSPIRLVETCLEAKGLRSYFAFCVSAESVGKGKTEPDIFLMAANQLNSKPSETVVFEDSLTAGRTAKRAGFPVAAVYDETGQAEWETFQSIADYVIRDWEL